MGPEPQAATNVKTKDNVSQRCTPVLLHERGSGFTLERMKITSLIAILVVGLAASAPAHAQGWGPSYVGKRKFGIGLELGEPTGLTGKLFIAPSNAIDFGLGEQYHHYYGGDGLHVYLDYLWHPAVLTRAEGFDLPFYVGIGGRIWFFDYDCAGRVCTGAEAFGVRVPLGISFDFRRVPLDIFIQAVPTLDFFRDYRHDIFLDIDFSVGVRFWF